MSYKVKLNKSPRHFAAGFMFCSDLVNRLHNYYVVLFEQCLVFLGEVVVGYKDVDILDMSKGIGIDFAYLGAVQHHIDVPCLLENLL